jgi:hypothetical protein
MGFGQVLRQDGAESSDCGVTSAQLACPADCSYRKRGVSGVANPGGTDQSTDRIGTMSGDPIAVSDARLGGRLAGSNEESVKVL